MYIDYRNIKTNYIYAWLLRSNSQVKMTMTKANRLRLTLYVMTIVVTSEIVRYMNALSTNNCLQLSSVTIKPQQFSKR